MNIFKKKEILTIENEVITYKYVAEMFNNKTYSKININNCIIIVKLLSEEYEEVLELLFNLNRIKKITFNDNCMIELEYIDEDTTFIVPYTDIKQRKTSSTFSPLSLIKK